MLHINIPTDGYEKIHPLSSGYRQEDGTVEITQSENIY
jgi:hypothetical protein